MKVGIPLEVLATETRGAATPKTVQRLIKQGFEVLVEKNAGSKALFSDESFLEAGAHLVADANTLLSSVDIILKVQPLTKDEMNAVRPGTMVASYLWPAQNGELLKILAEKKINAVAMDAIPRISRAQKMDVLSSMANIAGYRAVIEGANYFGRFLNGQIIVDFKINKVI
jgi:NAD(P) transhydrogenase subunit alpha